MEPTTGLITIIIITGLTSSALSLCAKLIYDGIKAKKNGNNKQPNNGQVSVNLALLAKDIDFNNSRLVSIENSINRLVELSVASNIHLEDFKNALVSTMVRLENKLESKL